MLENLKVYEYYKLTLSLFLVSLNDLIHDFEAFYELGIVRAFLLLHRLEINPAMVTTNL